MKTLILQQFLNQNMKPAVDKLNSGIKITQENCISKELLVANHHRMNDYQPL